MNRTLGQVAEAVGATLRGDAAVSISGVASIQRATATDLVFVEDQKYLLPAEASNAGAIIVGKFAADSSGSKPLLIAGHPKLAFARAARFLLEDGPKQGTIHPAAIIASTARMGAGVSVGGYAMVGEHAEIGDHCAIGAGCIVGDGVQIGAGSVLFPRVTIYSGTILGERVFVHAGAVLGSDGFGYVRDAATGRYEKFPQAGRLVIEDDVEIGANATIDRGALDETRIGRGSKIDNLVHIGHNCQIGENVVMAAQVGISGSVVIEDNVLLGGQVGIADRVRLQEGVIVGAQGGVPSHKILRGKGEVFWGTPAQPLKRYLKQLAQLGRLERKS